MSEISGTTREQALHAWLQHTLQSDRYTLTPVSGDASFRRYFRATLDGTSLIVMDAPPDKEDCAPFVAIARHWRQHGVEVPPLHARDLEQGFLLLGDFGDDLLLQALRDASGQPQVAAANHYYAEAMRALLAIQQLPKDPQYTLPPYDHALLMREMALFRDWLVTQHLQRSLSAEEQALFADCFEALAAVALAQPTVPVHRDYHSRNLMCLSEGRLGILDFQDAVQGPITYDLVSLLRDCYIVWPAAEVYRWVESYRQQALQHGLPLPGQSEFERWFDLMGVQRHLKASGIFARLSIRDGKHGYLASIPDTVNYLRRIMPRYSETQALGQWIEQHMVAPLNLAPELT